MPDLSIPLWQIPLLFFVGVLASFLNSLSGGGSTISLPLLIYLGIPPTMANGTNRLAILSGNIASVLSLRKGGFLERGIFRQLALPIVLGAIAGALLAVKMSDSVFRIALAGALVFVVIASNLKTDVLAGPPVPQPFRADKWAWLAFFGVGFYGGLIQLGIGFILIFALVRFTGLDLIRVNALKSLISSLFILISVLIFMKAQLISWPAAIAQGVGGIFGGWLGGHFQIRKGEKVIQRSIQIGALIMAVKLVWDVFKD